jgi:DHA1 family inner membrane transport protein
MRMPLVLVVLAAAAFAIGTTEFVVVGLVPTISTDLGVSVSAAGTLVTGYAVGVALGGVVLTALTTRVPRRRLLVSLMAVFAAGHVLMAVVPGFPLLLAARVITAPCHGAFFGIGAVVAAELVPVERRSRAIAVMFTGLTLATVMGVPAGTLLGQAAGWRAPFLAVAVMAAATAVALARLLPRTVGGVPARSERPGVEPRRVGPLVIALLTTVLGWGSQFIGFTFFAAYLHQITELGQGAVTALLLVFGVASAIGNVLGGRANDAWPRAAVPALLAGLALVQLLFALFGGNAVVVAVLVFAWGVVGFAIVPGMQTGVMAVAGEGSALGSTLNIAAFNVGIAGASTVGAVLVAGDLLRWTPAVGAAVALLAVPLALRRGLPERAAHA